MTQECSAILDPRTQAALDELRGMIRRRYPEARFAVSRGHDEPENVHLLTTVDLDDADEVLDLVLDRLLELQVEERLPIHVIPLRSPERVLAALRPQVAALTAGPRAQAASASRVGTGRRAVT